MPMIFQTVLAPREPIELISFEIPNFRPSCRSQKEARCAGLGGYRENRAKVRTAQHGGDLFGDRCAVRKSNLDGRRQEHTPSNMTCRI